MYTLNYPIETEEAQRFWASINKDNKIKAIIAFSLNLDNANHNLRRYGYKNIYRKIKLKEFGEYVNNPSMVGIPFTE